MQVRPKITLIVALILALLGTTLVWLYAEQLDDEHEALVADQVEVVKAIRNIPAGTSLTKDRITTEKVPRKFLPPNPLLEAELNIYLGTPVAQNVEEGAMILTSDFSFALKPPPDSIDNPASRGHDNRLIIKTGRLQLESDAPLQLAGRLTSAAEQSGGYVVKSTSTGLEGIAHIEMTLRVPAAKFDGVLTEFRRSGTLLGEALEGTDVTTKFIDLDAQARNHRALEARLLTFLDKAETVDDAMKLEDQISKVRTESDQLEGRARALQEQDALSTIHVTIQPPRAPQKKVEVEESGIFDPIVQAFEDSAHIMVSMFAALIRLIAGLIPVLASTLPFALVGLMVWRRRESSDAGRDGDAE